MKTNKIKLSIEIKSGPKTPIDVSVDYYSNKYISIGGEIFDTAIISKKIQKLIYSWMKNQEKIIKSDL